MRRSLVLAIAALLTIAVAQPVFADGIVSKEIEWGHARTMLREGDITVTVIQKADAPNGRYFPQAVIRAGSATVFNEHFDPGLRVTRLTFVPGHGEDRPFVDVETFTGGAHCCFDHVIISIGADAAQTRLVDWPGNSEFVNVSWERVGEHYLLSGGVNTGYDFSSHAGSTSAIVIYGLQRTGSLRFIDITKSYPDRLQADAAKHVTNFNQPDGGEAHMAAYLADEIRLGHGEEAWADVRRTYRKGPADFAAFKASAKKWLSARGFTQSSG
jgi:hypothetical protein